MQQVSAQPSLQSCPALSSLTQSPFYVNDGFAATSATVAGLRKGGVYCVYLRAQNSRLLVFSSPAVLMARPVGPPLGPTQLSLLLNPSNLTNLTATVPGFVVWMPPADVGAGPGVPVPIAGYALELYPCAGPGANSTVTALSYAYNFALGCSYVVRVAARNQQDAGLGAFSAWGPYQTLSVYVSQVTLPVCPARSFGMERRAEQVSAIRSAHLLSPPPPLFSEGRCRLRLDSAAAQGVSNKGAGAAGGRRAPVQLWRDASGGWKLRCV